MKQHTQRLLDDAVFETLEGRDMLSATALGDVTFSDGVLTLTAAAKDSTQMTVSYSRKSSSEIVARAGKSVQVVPASQVTQIVVDGGAGTENIHIDPNITAATTVNIGTGNAAVAAGTGDTVNSGSGRNAIRLQGGSNTVHLGSGVDVVQASQVGADVIYSGSGKAVINGSMARGSIVDATPKDKLLNTGYDQVSKAGVSSSTTPTTTTTATTSGTTTTTGSSTAPSGTGSSTSGGSSSSSSTGSSTTTSSNPPASTSGGGTSTSGSGQTSGQTGTATATDAEAPQPVISVLAGVQQTGLVVNVSGMQSTLGAGTVLDATYAWDFGDPNGAHNTITGFTAGHVYDTAGTYTITLTLTNANGDTAVTTQQVTIAASTRNAIYVDAVNGSDSNNGSQNAPYQTLAKAFSNIGDNTEVLLKAGETFTIDAALNVDVSNVVVGKYGSGADPVLNRVVGNGTGTFYTDNASNGVTFENLTFDSPYGVAANGIAGSTGVSGIYIGGSNITVRDCTFLNIDDAMNENAGPTGVLVMDNTAPLATGVRGYFVWGVGSQTTIIGNTVANSTRQHDIRMYGWTLFTIEDNNLTNLDRSSVDSGDFSKGCIEMQAGSYGYVEGNTATDGEIRTGPLGEWGEPTTDTTSWVVIKDNTLNDTYMHFGAASQHVLFENNVITADNNTDVLIDADTTTGYLSNDLQIVDNTGFGTGTIGDFLRVNGVVSGVTLMNNAYIAPSIIPGGWGTAGIYVNMNGLGDFTSIANNIWPDPTTIYGYANGGVNYVATQTDGYVTNTAWDSFSQVHDDQFANIQPSDLVNNYQVTVGGVTAGSTMPLAA